MTNATEIVITLQSEKGGWLRGRLSTLAKSQGGENAPARRYRNKLVQTGLTQTEYDEALQMIGVETGGEDK